MVWVILNGRAKEGNKAVMQSAAKHLACGSNQLYSTIRLVQLGAAREMSRKLDMTFLLLDYFPWQDASTPLRCALHDRLIALLP